MRNIFAIFPLATLLLLAYPLSALSQMPLPSDNIDERITQYDKWLFADGHFERIRLAEDRTKFNSSGIAQAYGQVNIYRSLEYLSTISTKQQRNQLGAEFSASFPLLTFHVTRTWPFLNGDEDIYVFNIVAPADRKIFSDLFPNRIPELDNPRTNSSCMSDACCFQTIPIKGSFTKTMVLFDPRPLAAKEKLRSAEVCYVAGILYHMGMAGVLNHHEEMVITFNGNALNGDRKRKEVIAINENSLNLFAPFYGPHKTILGKGVVSGDNREDVLEQLRQNLTSLRLETDEPKL